MTSEVLQILMSPDNPYFRLSTFGHAGSTHVRFVHVFHRLGSRFCRSCSVCCEQMQFNSEHTCFLMFFQSDFPKESDMVESFECQQTQTNRYNYYFIMQGIRPIQQILICVDGHCEMNTNFVMLLGSKNSIFFSALGTKLVFSSHQLRHYNFQARFPSEWTIEDFCHCST